MINQPISELTFRGVEGDMLVKREFSVRWLAQFELIVKAEDEEQAIIEATNRLKDGDLVEYFDLHCRRIMTK